MSEKYMAIIKRKDALFGQAVYTNGVLYNSRDEAIKHAEKQIPTGLSDAKIKTIKSSDTNLDEIFIPLTTPDMKISPEFSNECKMAIAKAKEIAYKAHEGQTDYNGLPYIEHPLVVSSWCKSYEGKVVGLLHDVIEDTNITFEDLKNEGFDSTVLDAIKLVTKEPGYNLKEYFERIKDNWVAKEVKINDLIHNYDMNRIVDATEYNRLKSDIYLLELQYLQTEKMEFPLEEIQKLEHKMQIFKEEHKELFIKYDKNNVSSIEDDLKKMVNVNDIKNLANKIIY